MIRQFDEGRHAKQFHRIKHLNLAFVVDECHRAVTPERQRQLSQFFVNSLWYGLLQVLPSLKKINVNKR